MFTHYSINQMDSTVAALCIISHAKFQSLERSYAGVEHSWTWHHEFATVGWKGEEKKTTSDLCSNVGKTISSIKVILIVITVMLKLTTDRIRFSYSSRCCLSYRNLTRTLKKRKWTGRKIVSKTRKAEQNTAERKTIEAGPFQQQQQKKNSVAVFYPLCSFSTGLFFFEQGADGVRGRFGGGGVFSSERASATFARACAVLRLSCALSVMWWGEKRRRGRGTGGGGRSEERGETGRELRRKKKEREVTLRCYSDCLGFGWFSLTIMGYFGA